MFKIRSILLLALLATLSVFGQPSTSSDSPADLETIRRLLGDKSKPVTWVLTGDSITHGAKHTRGNRSYVEHFAERLRWEMGRPNDIVVNTGISGDKADGILKGFDWRVGRFKPAVVSIMIGMNDCTRGPDKRGEFRTNLVELIKRVRTTGAVPIVHTMNIVEPSAAKDRGDLPAYVAIVNEVARAERAILVDHWAHWQRANAKPGQLQEWLNDPIHPNGRGHREMAILMFKSIGIYDPKSPTCQPLPP